jgi:hypothetical protein
MNIERNIERPPEVAEDVRPVSFKDCDLGFFGNTQNRVKPMGENPFAPEVLPISSE